MNLKEYVDNAESMDIKETKNKTLTDLILKFHAKHISRLYILKENRPIFVFSPKEIVNIFLNNQHTKNAYEFLNKKEFLNCFNSDMHIIDAYYKMRKDNIFFMPVCENGKFIGEIDFNILNLKITYIVIKDELSGVYNKKYFDVIVEEYRDFNKPIGMIFIELKDLPIFEGLYGVEMIHKVIKEYANIIKNSVRKIDFIFRWDNQFRIMIFNNLEVTAKVFERLKNKFDNFTIDNIHIPYNICMTHIPEINRDILMGIEECEEKLIKGD